MSSHKGIAYLDHNVLNDMYDGQEEEVLLYLNNEQLQVVYSDQNLDEICDSAVRKDHFIGYLNKLNAIHISSPLDTNWKPTNQLNVSHIKPADRILELQEARESSAPISDGMDVMAKFFGNSEEASMGELVSAKLDEAEDLIKSLVGETPELANSSMVIKAFEDIESARAQTAAPMSELDAELEKNGSPFEADNIKSHIGYDMAEISGVKAPKVIETLWSMVGSTFGGYETIEEYQQVIMKLASADFGLHGTVELTQVQKANDFYLWLNMIGFHRDEKIKKLRKMRGSDADMNHASYAMTCCTHFLCNDRRLRLKAEAIYEHMSIGTKIIDTRKMFETADVS